MSLAAERDDQAIGPDGSAPSAAPAARRILLVDPGADICEALKEAMAADGPHWQVDWAVGGEEALRKLGAESADVVVVDEQLAEMDGVTLLTRVRDRHPTAIRIILSEAASSQRPSVAAMVAHRMLAKPCVVGELETAIRRSCDLRTLTGEAEAYRRTMAAAALPSRPGVYMELNQFLGDPNWQPSHIAAVVERDVALSAKVLQLANSALFGLSQEVTTIQGAVMFLGVDTIRSLALTAEAFGKLAPRNTEAFSIDEFQNHAMLVARITAAVLPAGRVQQEAVTAALLHDIGKLVLVADRGSRWAELNREATERGLPLHDIETEREGVTHADLGAHLLSLWGLPDGIAEAVAHHHRPVAVEGLELDAVAAVHIANALAHELHPPLEGAPPYQPLEEELLDRLDLRPRLDLWRRLARQLDAAASAPPVRRR
jgi:HD-like signal output (HDOD) protein/ActR/RegA family two-component response regulator